MQSLITERTDTIQLNNDYDNITNMSITNMYNGH